MQVHTVPDTRSSPSLISNFSEAELYNFLWKICTGSMPCSSFPRFLGPFQTTPSEGRCKKQGWIDNKSEGEKVKFYKGAVVAFLLGQWQGKKA